MAGEFTADMETIRARAREQMHRGPVTEEYGADPAQVVKLLNEVLATETVCELRYKHHYYMADGVHAETAKPEFLEHANEERMHADWVAARIVQLGGRPNFDPEGLNTRSHADYVEGDSLREMIEEDLVAERTAISTYQEVVRWLGAETPPRVVSSSRCSNRRSSTPTTCSVCSSTSPSPPSFLAPDAGPPRASQLPARWRTPTNCPPRAAAEAVGMGSPDSGHHP